MDWPDRIETEEQLEEVLSRPSLALVESLSRLDGDLLILGVAGKMGPTLARLARRALDEGGRGARVIGVSRFSTPATREKLEAAGVETVKADLLDRKALADLPDSPNVVYLAARKFGSTGDEPFTWAMNTYLPGRVAVSFAGKRIVALSTGNVYPLTSIDSPGPTEDDLVDPIGEYAQSCLGRERMFQYFSNLHGTRTALVRLNYAIDLRYGVLLDLARKVQAGVPVPLAMGHVNVIWQGDANTAILRCFDHCASPAFVLNLTGPRVLSVRWIAEEFGCRLGKKAAFEGDEADTALLSNAARYRDLMGGPTVTIEQMLDWVSHWVEIGGPTLDKPTHFETRDGRF
jgi:nucleoside-diphosphate-sugar epimerase